jgi:hypothetical protein
VSDQQTAAIRAAATKRTAHAEARVRKALSAIATSGAEVNFVAVATAARVSRQFLYSHPGLRAEIDQLRTQALVVPRLPARASAGDDSARSRLRATLDDNQRLRDENRLLKEELAIAHGELRELRHSRARDTVPQP